MSIHLKRIVLQDNWIVGSNSKLPCCSCVCNLVNLSCNMEVFKTLNICGPIYSSSWTSKIKRLKAIKESKRCRFRSVMRSWKLLFCVLRSHVWSWLLRSCEPVIVWRDGGCMSMYRYRYQTWWLPNEILYSKGQPTSWCLPAAGVKGRSRMQGLLTSMTAFDSAQLLTLAQPGPEGLQA